MSVARHALVLESSAEPWRLRAWLLGGGVIAALELALATAYWSWQGVPALRTAQGVAAWWLGREAYAGGATTALLGYLLYAGMLTAAVAVYDLAARRHSLLRRRPLRCGALYGLAVYVVLIEVLVPLLAAYPAGSARWDWRLTCAAAYALCVGCGSAVVARLSRRDV